MTIDVGLGRARQRENDSAVVDNYHRKKWFDKISWSEEYSYRLHHRRHSRRAHSVVTPHAVALRNWKTDHAKRSPRLFRRIRRSWNVFSDRLVWPLTVD